MKSKSKSKFHEYVSLLNTLADTHEAIIALALPHAGGDQEWRTVHNRHKAQGEWFRGLAEKYEGAHKEITAKAEAKVARREHFDALKAAKAESKASKTAKATPADDPMAAVMAQLAALSQVVATLSAAPAKPAPKSAADKLRAASK